MGQDVSYSSYDNDEEDYWYELNVVLPKLRSKEANINDIFDKTLLQRRDAFINDRFVIIDPNTIKIKLCDLKNGAKSNKYEETDNDQDSISILNSDKVQKMVQKHFVSKPPKPPSPDYSKLYPLNDNNNNDINDDYNNNTDENVGNCHKRSFDEASDETDFPPSKKFKSSESEKKEKNEPYFTEFIDEYYYPPQLFWNEYPLKCKWTDDCGDIHIEHFKFMAMNSVINTVLNVDKMNHPLCINWCVKYEKNKNKNKNECISEDRTKSFDYDLFWSCCINYKLFKTSGSIQYDEYFKQLLTDNVAKKIQDDKKECNVIYHNQQIVGTNNHDQHVCTPWCASDKYSDPQYWFVTHGIKEIKSKPVDMNDPFYKKMIQRKKAMILGKFYMIDRELREKEEDNDNILILDREYIGEISSNFASNNDILSYKLASNGMYEYMDKNGDFNLSECNDGHRCIAVWTDDDGNKYEEWFKFYKRCSISIGEDEDALTSIRWKVGYQLKFPGNDMNNFEKYCDLNNFWSIGAYYKIFGICGIKEYDQQFYQLLKLFTNQK